jgi:hypothetical protein
MTKNVLQLWKHVLASVVGGGLLFAALYAGEAGVIDPTVTEALKGLAGLYSVFEGAKDLAKDGHKELGNGEL